MYNEPKAKPAKIQQKKLLIKPVIGSGGAYLDGCTVTFVNAVFGLAQERIARAKGSADAWADANFGDIGRFGVIRFPTRVLPFSPTSGVRLCSPKQAKALPKACKS
jgi:hypothetical protein